MVDCVDESETVMVAEKLARQLGGGELIELRGDVGSGKTTFVKGLAIGFGSKDKVSSPSFALKNEYEGRLKLYHFDLYRLEEPGIMSHEISETLGRKDSVTVIEWAEKGGDILPANRIKVEFMPAGAHARKLIISYPKGR